MRINASSLDYKAINAQIRNSSDSIEITQCCGQRFIAAGFSDKKIHIQGTPGNALGAYLNGAEITVNGNAQDAVGDTMNDGKIIIHGNVGDAAGYAMRGGEIYVKGDAGYRIGIHMKEYEEKKPLIVIGGKCGSFLGEYQAGGILIVLGLSKNDKKIVSNYPCTGMHGGKVYLRADVKDLTLPENVTASLVTEEGMKEIQEYLKKFCSYFDYDLESILRSPFTVIEPDSSNPYQQMYVPN